MAPRPNRTPPQRPARPLIHPIDVSDLTTYPLKNRHSKVRVSDFATPWKRGGSFEQFFASLPDLLAVKTLRAVADAIGTAHRRHRPVIVGIGAHVIKVGLAPLLVDLMERGIVTALAMNGAGIIHDFELALMGHTSDEVDAEIDEGRFGMAEDTGRILNEAITLGAQRGQGLGEAVGHYINRYQGQFPNRATSLLATGARLGIPVTVHVAIGTDIIHMHPAADGAAGEDRDVGIGRRSEARVQVELVGQRVVAALHRPRREGRRVARVGARAQLPVRTQAASLAWVAGGSGRR